MGGDADDDDDAIDGNDVNCDDAIDGNDVNLMTTTTITTKWIVSLLKVNEKLSLDAREQAN